MALQEKRPNISEKFKELREKGEGALISYVMAGDPSSEATEKIVEALVKGGADIIELGLPFSDPVADGPVIQAAGERGLAAGMNTDRYFELVKGLAPSIPFVCMTYYNLIFKYGLDKFSKKCRETGICGLIVPDLPVEEAGDLAHSCREEGIDLIFLVAPTTPKKRIKKILAETGGFVYLVSRLGVTGKRRELSTFAKELLERVESEIPKAVGFGVSNASQTEELILAGADAVIVGSAFVEIIASKNRAPERVEALARELKAGIRKAGLAVGKQEHEIEGTGSETHEAIHPEIA